MRPARASFGAHGHDLVVPRVLQSDSDAICRSDKDAHATVAQSSEHGADCPLLPILCGAAAIAMPGYNFAANRQVAGAMPMAAERIWYPTQIQGNLLNGPNRLNGRGYFDLRGFLI